MFSKKDNGFLIFANLISVHLKLCFSRYKSHPLSSELQYALHNCFVFLKLSLFFCTTSFHKIFVILAYLPILFRFLFFFHSITIMAIWKKSNPKKFMFLVKSFCLIGWDTVFKQILNFFACICRSFCSLLTYPGELKVSITF